MGRERQHWLLLARVPGSCRLRWFGIPEAWDPPISEVGSGEQHGVGKAVPAGGCRRKLALASGPPDTVAAPAVPFPTEPSPPPHLALTGQPLRFHVALGPETQVRSPIARSVTPSPCEAPFALQDTVLSFQSFPAGFSGWGGHSSCSPSPLSGLQSSGLSSVPQPGVQSPTRVVSIGHRRPLRVLHPGQDPSPPVGTGKKM